MAKRTGSVGDGLTIEGTLTATAADSAAASGGPQFPGLWLIASPGRAAQGATLRLSDEPRVLGRKTALDGGGTLEDPRVSAAHAEVRLSSSLRATVTDLGSRNGTFVNGGRVTGPTIVGPDDVLQLGSSFLQLVPNVLVCSGPEVNDAVRRELVGPSPEMRDLRNKIRQLAPLEVSVLVLGPSGSGKERAASALHQASGRDGALVCLNCAVLTEDSAASELFGHVKGAFTGAAGARLGAFRRAEGGTLFLDEIGELPLGLQAKLLRALQERRVRPLGGDADVAVDVRVVTATNRDLPAAVRQGSFRGDLFSRIAVAVLELSPLRGRAADIVALAQHFLGPEHDLHPRAIEELIAHDWPYNVRDVKALVALLAPVAGEPVELNQPARDRLRIAQQLAGPEDADPAEAHGAPVWPDDDDARRDLLVRLLTQARGNISKVARMIDRPARSLRRWLKQYEIDPDRFR